MKRICTLLLYITIIVFSAAQPASAITVFCTNCSTLFTQIRQLANEIFTANTSAITAASTKTLAVNESILDPIANTLINVVLEQATRSVISWANGGFQGDPLIISNPEKYIEDAGLEAVKLATADIPKDGVFSESLLSGIINNYRYDSDITSKIVGLASSNIPSILQKNICSEDSLNRLAVQDLSLSDGEYNAEDYQARKTLIYTSLCQGDPTTDGNLAKRLVSVNEARPEIGGLDSFLAITSGQNEYTKTVKLQQIVAEEKAKAEERKKKDLEVGGGVASETKCKSRLLVDIEGNPYGNTEEAPCLDEIIVTPSGAVQDMLNKAMTAGMERLTNIQGSGTLTNVLAQLATSALFKAVSSAFSDSGETSPNAPSFGTNTSVTVQDLANDPERKDELVRNVFTYINLNATTLEKLQRIDEDYLTEIAVYGAKIDGMWACYSPLLRDYLDPTTGAMASSTSFGDHRVITASGFYNAKRISTDSLKAEITREIGKIATAKTLTENARAAILKSTSSKEIYQIFSNYQNQFDTQGLPSVEIMSMREGELITYKFMSQEESSKGEITGIITSLTQACESGIGVSNTNPF